MKRVVVNAMVVIARLARKPVPEGNLDALRTLNLIEVQLWLIIDLRLRFCLNMQLLSLVNQRYSEAAADAGILFLRLRRSLA